MSAHAPSRRPGRSRIDALLVAACDEATADTRDRWLAALALPCTSPGAVALMRATRLEHERARHAWLLRVLPVAEA